MSGWQLYFSYFVPAAVAFPQEYDKIGNMIADFMIKSESEE